MYVLPRATAARSASLVFLRQRRGAADRSQGLAYRNAAPEVLRLAVEDAILCIDVHPEAIDGALVQAKAVAIAATTELESFNPVGMLQTLTDGNDAGQSWTL